MTTSIATILCPVDFSPASLAAAGTAAALCKAVAARLLLLYVVNGTNPVAPSVEAGGSPSEQSRADGPPANALAEHERNTRVRLNALASELRAKGVEDVFVLLVAGPTVELIGRVAEDFGATLIVMGRASRNGVGRIIGSVTERTACRSRTSVLVCPALDA